MTTIILTNPDIILYHGNDPKEIAREIEAYEVLRDAGVIPEDRELKIDPLPSKSEISSP